MITAVSSTWRRILTVAISAIAALVVFAPAASAQPLHPQTTASSADASPATATSSPSSSTTSQLTPAVLVAVPDLSWSDVSPSATPTLWRMIGSGSVASLTTGRTTCYMNLWLTLSAGRPVKAEQDDQTAGQPTSSPTDAASNGDQGEISDGCPQMPTPTTTSAETKGFSSAQIPGWTDLTTPKDPTIKNKQQGVPSTVATRLNTAGICSQAVGPGAAIMLADSNGRVSRYASTFSQVPRSALSACPLTVIDEGALQSSGSGRSQDLKDLDKTLSRLMREMPSHGRLLIAGITDGSSGSSGLQVLVDWRPGETTDRWLYSPSTKKDGLAQLVDLSATTLSTVGAESTDLDGSPLVLGQPRGIDTARTVENRHYLNELTTTIPTLYPIVVGILIVTLVIALAWVWYRRRRSSRPRDPDAPAAAPATESGIGRRIISCALLLAASAPVAASIASLSRWWTTASPQTMAAVAFTVSMVVVALASWAIARRLPRNPWSLPTCVAGITWAVLTIDGLLGTPLQQASLLGTSAVVGFTRFYGFNNVTFSVYAAASLVFAAGLATILGKKTGRDKAGIITICCIALITIGVDGWPAFGADFGSIPALVPGFAILVLLVARIRITWPRILAIAGATVAAVTAVAVIDWLSPGDESHFGQFIQTIPDGTTWDVIARKAGGAWATVANPAGAAAAIIVIVASIAVLWPARFKLKSIIQANALWPLLRPMTVALVIVAIVGSCVNDSGIIIGALVYSVAGAMILPGFIMRIPDRGKNTQEIPADNLNEAGRIMRTIPATLTALGGGLLILVLLASTLPSSVAFRSPDRVGTAGDEVHPTAADQVSNKGSLVVIGTAGLQWQNVQDGQLPTIKSLVGDGATAGGLSQPTGVASRCSVSGWMAMSAGTLTQVATSRDADGAWDCPTPQAVPNASGGATVDDWSTLVSLQHGSQYESSMGALGTALNGSPAQGSGAREPGCTTAVGSGAAVALADSKGSVSRYRSVDQALTAHSDAFSCPVTVVDAGDATVTSSRDLTAEQRALPADQRSQILEDLKTQRLADVDSTIRRVVNAAPSNATIVIADTAGTPGARPVLGVGLVRPGPDGPTRPRYLTSAATKTDGVARVLDLPSTILDAAGRTIPASIDNTPMAYGSPRPMDANTTIQDLSEITSRDLVKRAVYSWFVDIPLYAGMALAVACLLVGVFVRRRSRMFDRLLTVGRIAAYALASWSVAAYLATLADWWQTSSPTLTLFIAVGLCTAIITAIAALAPRKPIWVGPGIIAAITFLVITLDGLLGTPLARVASLGPAPTFGARFYGFSNPTFSVWEAGGILFAAALGQYLVNAGRRRWAAFTIAAIGLIAMIVDIWPTLGADVGGGLVLIPGFAVLALAALGTRITWVRVFCVAVVGVALVALVGFFDWLRPAQARTHLGRFFGQVIDGDAWDIIMRKAGYALRSVLGGPAVWLTIAVLILAALLLFWSRRCTPGWFSRAEGYWPLLRPMLLAWWIISVGGALVNDFGVRVAEVALVPQIPLLVAVALGALMVSRHEDVSAGLALGGPATSPTGPAIATTAPTTGAAAAAPALPETGTTTPATGTPTT